MANTVKANSAIEWVRIEEFVTSTRVSILLH